MTTLLLCLAALATPQDPPHIFGLHENGGESHMADMGRKGWIVFTEEVGRNPLDSGGKDFTPWSAQGYGVIVRINHGYGPSQGTLPYSHHYDAFAQRVARYVQASKGCTRWQIGNETNHSQEWPRYEGWEQKITAAMYVSCFRKCRDLIKALPGHAADLVIPQPTAPWSVAVGQGWIEYHAEMLQSIGAGGLDGISIHTYTHGSNPSLVFSESKMNPPYQNRYYNFRAYRDFMNAIPAWARALPVYITECSQNGPWADANSGWVRNAYREINDWNLTAGTQKIRALCLYRWPNRDPSYIVGKNGVINDFREAMRNDYRWTTGGPVPGFPDVVVTALSYADGVFTATVKNQGAASTPAGVSIGVAYFVDGGYRTWGTVPGPLAAGATVTVGTNGGNFAIPTGTHAILAFVDDVNRFAESNESNNQFSRSITVGPALPDVVVTSLSYAGGNFQCAVKNQGAAATPSGVSVGVGYFADGVYRTWGSIPGPVAAGATVTIGTNGGPFHLAPGTHSIAARVDDVNRFGESDEGNNLFTTSVTIGASLEAEVPVEEPELPSEDGPARSCGALGLELFFILALRRRRSGG